MYPICYFKCFPCSCKGGQVIVFGRAYFGGIPIYFKRISYLWSHLLYPKWPVCAPAWTCKFVWFERGRWPLSAQLKALIRLELKLGLFPFIHIYICAFPHINSINQRCQFTIKRAKLLRQISLHWFGSWTWPAFWPTVNFHVRNHSGHFSKIWCWPLASRQVKFKIRISAEIFGTARTIF